MRLMVAFYFALFLISVTLTGLALVATTDGVWFVALPLLVPPAAMGLWLSRE